MARSVSNTGGGGFRPVSETVLMSRPAEPAGHPRSALASGTLLSDRFLVEDWVGRGGMGDVYRGRDLSTQSMVAIKVIARFEPEDTDRFMREAAVLATLSHPAIVRYVAHGAAPSGNPFLVMAWLCGRDLSARLIEAPLTAAETFALARRVCEGLQVAWCTAT
jgi:eukaryotic-like serine/threonine-protein kinase